MLPRCAAVNATRISTAPAIWAIWSIGRAYRPTSRLLVDAVRRVRADPLAQLGVADAGVDARLAGTGTALAPAGGPDQPQLARGGAAEHRPAGVALAGVDAALGEAGADHGLRIEVVAVGARAVLVGRDRYLRLLHHVRSAAALLGGAPADDGLHRAGR